MHDIGCSSDVCSVSAWELPVGGAFRRKASHGTGILHPAMWGSALRVIVGTIRAPLRRDCWRLHGAPRLLWRGLEAVGTEGVAVKELSLAYLHDDILVCTIHTKYGVACLKFLDEEQPSTVRAGCMRQLPRVTVQQVEPRVCWFHAIGFC